MKKRLFLISLTLSCICYSTPVKWALDDGGNGHWYEVVLAPNIDWDTANQATSDRAGDWYLTTITSEAENAFVLSLFLNIDEAWVYSGHSSLVGHVYSGPWIGGQSSSFSANDWSWSTGEAFSYNAWGPYEPFGNGNRISFAKLGSSIGWNDLRNYSLTTGYIVESVIPEPATVSLLALGSMLAGRRRGVRSA